eukprot:GHVS01075209.1.p1 GENE.GHVS01075209.1~~GHVS01075209.1.p1  ORF type:complete len:199 (-),score=42.64 GHVS01075209.1:188-784(-)
MAYQQQPRYLTGETPPSRQPTVSFYNQQGGEGGALSSYPSTTQDIYGICESGMELDSQQYYYIDEQQQQEQHQQPPPLQQQEVLTRARSYRFDEETNKWVHPDGEVEGSYMLPDIKYEKVIHDETASPSQQRRRTKQLERALTLFRRSRGGSLADEIAAQGVSKYISTQSSDLPQVDMYELTPRYPRTKKHVNNSFCC